MRNLIVSTLALLIYPLSLSAQNSFSVSLDVDGSAGDQGVTSLNTAPDQVVAIEIFGKDIQNANGLAARFEYDASQVTYEGFDVGDVLPNAQALPEQGTDYVEIGMASLGGQATANSGLAGTIRFRTTAAFSGTAIQLVRAELSRAGQFETIMPNIRIALQGAPTPVNFSLSLDVDGAAGDQAVTSANVSTDEMIAIEIFGKDIQNANGVSIRFEYDANQVVYEGFNASDVLPNAQALTEQGSGFVEIGIASWGGGQTTANSGLVGTVRFRTTGAFSGTSIRLVRAELGRGGRFETITLDVRVALELQVLTPDFNSDGMVNFADFLQFTGQFGAHQGDGRYEAKYDLDSDGAIGFGDFLIFGRSFGQEVSTPGGGGGREQTQVTIPDANLRTVIEDSLGKTSGAPITPAEMASLTRLEAPDSDINDLTGLEFATDLIRLDLGEKYVAGSGHVNSNHISDLSPLANLTNLTALDLDGNFAFSDVSPLANLTNLRNLRLSNNFIKDISPLSALTNLRRLELDGNILSDISPLSALTNLTNLFLDTNTISDIAPLSGLTNLTWLSLDTNTISDIAPLSGLTNLTWLDLTGNTILDLSPLPGLTNLKRLYLSDNAISDVSELSGLTSIENLGLSYNVISDVSTLGGLTNLKQLWLHNNVISDVSVLSGMTRMESLGLHNNTISDIAPLSGLSNLTWLNIYNNVISDVSALSGMTRMETLGLSKNVISDVSALSGMTQLEWLNLSGNLISDVSALSDMARLTTLYLLDNTISDLSPLVANMGLGKGDRVDVRDNPLSTTSLNTHIPALQGRGVDVQFGASKPAIEEKETRPTRAAMKPFGFREPEEGEYLYRR